MSQAERAAEYLATWQWHYSLPYPSGSAADQIGYNTFGGTSVSVQHHHIDPWGVTIAVGWLRLGQLTGNRMWQERAAAAWRHGTMGISDGSLVIDGIARFAGGQDEGFMHTRWGRSPGSVSNWQVAWPGAFRLLTLYLFTIECKQGLILKNHSKQPSNRVNCLRFRSRNHSREIRKAFLRDGAIPSLLLKIHSENE